jgi:hypothetical protein
MQRKEKQDEYKEKEKNKSSVAFDAGKRPPKEFTKESYEEALRRASSRVSEHESEKTETSE